MKRRFENKVVLVTGAAGGIGLAIARAFASEGAKVMLADRDSAKLHAAEQLLRQEGGDVASVVVDVTDYSDCQKMVAAVVQRFNALDIACNNAGVPSPIAPFEEQSLLQWQRVMDVNLNGIFHCMKAQVPALRESGGTAIINTASVTSHLAFAGMAGYVASKHGVAGLTKASALDLIGYGIRVNAVAPGFIETPMLAPALEGEDGRAFFDARAPIGRIGRAEEVASCVLFLASAEASYVVGAVLNVDGGMALT
ncbi:MAG: SDR family oxidoreductase [Pseudomonas sp.]|jgi:NAD(P)-dependent dehydrogenase (short-subunit alcohol dehydrogenase family)|uniref:NAD(P)-dependent dehydrogenase, short-chain alcohol dehydrogenase family n=1 Tax=Pseudomonas psychrophila TaxID=122355 RepID=A0ABY0VQ07_9PSED|nr:MULTISPECIES: SDR family NAD(P)-dependent oxidoreductase [Pseudomonas]KAB0493524.1 SDR family oxidoreductase [Pseudomonas psychrophila]KMN02611.1 hypothetical protein TU76_02280 [Pseudomonas psychrophila]MBL1307480.1 SDR family oxidoreductase [Pseudomonas sp.]QIE32417.1 SDR family oxidoreductase [Pseudomonas psychrophila]WVI98961.1 SDR family NAD(P)-dependent oxidoreductase [Pseudomonas psychrophila]